MQNMNYRKMSDNALQKEREYIMAQISATMQRIQRVSVMLCTGQRDILSGTRLTQDLQTHLQALEAVTDEIGFRNLP